jgi:hypothetical protein
MWRMPFRKAVANLMLCPSGDSAPLRKRYDVPSSGNPGHPLPTQGSAILIECKKLELGHRGPKGLGMLTNGSACKGLSNSLRLRAMRANHSWGVGGEISESEIEGWRLPSRLLNEPDIIYM